jgi:hypothetical protein
VDEPRFLPQHVVHQAALAQVPGIWAIIQARWLATPEPEKQQLRSEWGTSLQALVNAAAVGNQAQASSGSLDQMVTKEIEHNWVSTMSQSHMTDTINLHLNMFR